MKPRPILIAAILALATLPAAAETTPTTTLATGEILIVGHTEPAAKVEVPAVMKGQLLEVKVKEGQAIKKNDELARLDDAIQIATVALARQEAEDTVQIRASENQRDFAKNEFDRYRTNPAASASEKREKELAVQQAELGVELRKSEQKQAVIKLEREQITLDHMTVRSPIDGSVYRVNKKAGEETDENPLFVIVDTSKLNAVFFPPKQVFGKIHTGDKVMLTLEGTTRAIPATVVTVDPVIEQDLFRVKCEIDNPDGQIPAGLGVNWTWFPR